jgi:hypothetical protein
MKLGIHAAGSGQHRFDARRQQQYAPAGGVVDHQRDEAFHRVTRGVRRHQRRHRPSADVVVDRPDELVAVGEALVEVALGQPGLTAHRAHGQGRPAGAAQ